MIELKAYIDGYCRPIEDLAKVQGHRTQIFGQGADEVADFITPETTPEEFDSFCRGNLAYALENGRREDGRNALGIAANYANRQLVEHIVKQKEGLINLCDNVGCSAVHICVLNTFHPITLKNSCHTLEQLISLGANINQVTYVPFKKDEVFFPLLTTPLWMALEVGSLPMIQLLLAHGGTIYTPLSKLGRSHAETAMNALSSPLKADFINKVIAKLGKKTSPFDLESWCAEQGHDFVDMQKRTRLPEVCTKLWFAIEYNLINSIEQRLLLGEKIIPALSPQGQTFIDAIVQKQFHKHQAALYKRCRLFMLGEQDPKSLVSRLPKEIHRIIAVAHAAFALASLASITEQSGICMLQ